MSYRSVGLGFYVTILYLLALASVGFLYGTLKVPGFRNSDWVLIYPIVALVLTGMSAFQLQAFARTLKRR